MISALLKQVVGEINHNHFKRHFNAWEKFVSIFAPDAKWVKQNRVAKRSNG
jgi:hypothetical protein